MEIEYLLYIFLQMCDFVFNCVGLAPRAALVVQRTDQQGVLTQGEGPGKMFVCYVTVRL